MSLRWRWFPSLLAAGFLLPGCSHDPSEERPSASYSGALTPVPPAFLTGPASLLLTQSDGFSGHLTMTTGTALPNGQGAAGELWQRASKLMFTPAPGKAKSSRGGFSFIWDVAQGRGYVLSEALQGCAPVTASITPTNLSSSAASPPSEVIDSHPCQAEQATVLMSDGSSASLHVWRATELKRFPIRISATNGATPFILTFSKIHLESQPVDLFDAPEGFTRYASPDAMLTELIFRQHNIRRAPVSVTEPSSDYRPRR